jgi:hypothetical protein
MIARPGVVTEENHNVESLETRMKFVVLFTLVFVASCSLRTTLEQLEGEALITGDWVAVERREELIKERREVSAPGCPAPLSKKCIEEQSGIECYCLPTANYY